MFSNEELISLFGNESVRKALGLEKNILDISSDEDIEGKEMEYLLSSNDEALKGNPEKCLFMAGLFRRLAIIRRGNVKYPSFLLYRDDYLLQGYLRGSGECGKELTYLHNERKDVKMALYEENFLSLDDEERGDLVKILMEEKMFDKGKEILERWEKVSPHNLTMLHMLAQAYLRRGDYEKSYRLFKRNEEHFHYWLGKLLFHGLGVERDIEEALLELRKSVTISKLIRYEEYTLMDYGDLFLSLLYHEGLYLPRSDARSDFFININRHRYLGDKDDEEREFRKFFLSSGFLSRREKKIDLLMKEGKYMELSRYLVYRGNDEEALKRVKVLHKAYKEGDIEATCFITLDIGHLSYDARWSEIEEEEYEKVADAKGLISFSGIDYDSNIRFTKREEERILSASSSNLLAYFPSLLYWSMARGSAASFKRLASLAANMDKEEFFARIYSGWVNIERAHFPYRLLEKEEGKRLYSLLLLADYSRIHDKEVDEYFDIDADALLKKDLYGEGELVLRVFLHFRQKSL